MVVVGDSVVLVLVLVEVLGVWVELVVVVGAWVLLVVVIPCVVVEDVVVGWGVEVVVGDKVVVVVSKIHRFHSGNTNIEEEEILRFYHGDNHFHFYSSYDQKAVIYC